MTGNLGLIAVLAETGPILLDFDGPVTHLFIDGRNRMVADRMRSALPSGVELPNDLRHTYDPLIILRWASRQLDQKDLDALETACIDGEVNAAAVSVPTPGAVELLRACAAGNRAVIIVSNNAEEPIRRFLTTHCIDHLVTDVVARVRGRPDLMKPNPTSIYAALERLSAAAADCAMIGDSVTDIEVCKATGVHSIGFAKNATRGQELRIAGADAIVDDLLEIARQPALWKPGSSG